MNTMQLSNDNVQKSEMTKLHKIWRRYKYFTPIIIIPAIMYISFHYLGYWSFFAFVFVYGFIPAMEFIFTGTSENFTAEEEAEERNDIYYDILIYSMVPLQFVILGLYLWTIASKPLHWYEYIGITTAMGLACGALGINVAHELGHRSKKYEQFLSKVLLMILCTCTFILSIIAGITKTCLPQWILLLRD